MQKARREVGRQGPHRDSGGGCTEELGPIKTLQKAQKGLRQERFVPRKNTRVETGREARKSAHLSGSEVVMRAGGRSGGDGLEMFRETVAEDAGWRVGGCRALWQWARETHVAKTSTGWCLSAASEKRVGEAILTGVSANRARNVRTRGQRDSRS